MSTSTPAPVAVSPVVANVAKGLLQLVAATLALVISAVKLGLTPYTLISLVVSLLTAAGVYVWPELPVGWRKRAKTIAAIVGAVLQAALAVVSPQWGWHVTMNDWILVILAAAAALGTEILPNADAVALTSIASVVSADLGGKHIAPPVVPAPAATTVVVNAAPAAAEAPAVPIPTVIPNP